MIEGRVLLQVQVAVAVDVRLFEPLLIFLHLFCVVFVSAVRREMCLLKFVPRDLAVLIWET